ncbi:MAG: hypothetical protein JTJ11_02330 [Collinsella sp.]|nr:hypothetical protein [Collinsella sp.]
MLLTSAELFSLLYQAIFWIVPRAIFLAAIYFVVRMAVAHALARHDKQQP